VILLFKKLEPRLAASVAFVAGWMFLPIAAINLPGLPDYTKTTAVCVGILAGAYIFDKERLSKFKFNALDLPMLLWCTAPFFSSVANGLGPYDGLSQTMYQSITWGLPYYIARIYFSDSSSMKVLAIAIFIGAVVYIPFCWFELIMSPQLHRLTYGYHQCNFLQTLRDGGGFRPMVYMEHGLMTAMWMALGIFLAVWLLYCRELPEKILFVPSRWLLLLLVFTTVMMKSVGALVLLAIALVVLYLSRKMKSAVLVVIMLLVPLLYIYTRTTGIWDGKNLSGYVAEKFSATRAQSLQFRFDNETILIDKALEGTFFGWGGYGRSRVYTEKGKDISVTDGLWIITLGQNGIYGLAAMFVTIELPLLLFILRIRPERWGSRELSAPAVMALFMSVYMIDNLLNGMINPIYMLFNGGIIGMLLEPASIQAESPVHQGSLEEGRRNIVLPVSRFITAPVPCQSHFIS
ncbi:MAG: hypothetical protein HGA70_10435, partial [Chlorobiaceae bacterium]|nr:hypothetical protein [Chlorobiaceae bacterium]